MRFGLHLGPCAAGPHALYSPVQVQHMSPALTAVLPLASPGPNAGRRRHAAQRVRQRACQPCHGVPPLCHVSKLAWGASVGLVRLMLVALQESALPRKHQASRHTCSPLLPHSTAGCPDRNPVVSSAATECASWLCRTGTHRDLSLTLSTDWHLVLLLIPCQPTAPVSSPLVSAILLTTQLLQPHACTALLLHQQLLVAPTLACATATDPSFAQPPA